MPVLSMEILDNDPDALPSALPAIVLLDEYCVSFVKSICTVCGVVEPLVKVKVVVPVPEAKAPFVSKSNVTGSIETVVVEPSASVQLVVVEPSIVSATLQVSSAAFVKVKYTGRSWTEPRVS